MLSHFFQFLKFCRYWGKNPENHLPLSQRGVLRVASSSAVSSTTVSHSVAPGVQFFCVPGAKGPQDVLIQSRESCRVFSSVKWTYQPLQWIKVAVKTKWDLGGERSSDYELRVIVRDYYYYALPGFSGAKVAVEEVWNNRDTWWPFFILHDPPPLIFLPVCFNVRAVNFGWLGW